MTNQEVFEQYGTEKWVIEQNLCFLLQGYWEDLYRKGYVKESQMPINPVSAVKEFMKEETICNLEYAEKSKMHTLENKAAEIIDGSFMELDSEVMEMS